MNNLDIIGIVIVGIFILFILNKKQKGKADYLLILINLLIAAFLFTDIRVKENLTTSIFIIQNLIPFYLFPTFFIFSVLIINYKQHLTGKWLWIYIPSVLFTIYIFLDQMVINQYSSVELRRIFDFPTLTYHFFYKGNQLFIIVSLIWLLRKIKLYDKKIRNAFSFIEPIQLNWLKYFSVIYLIISIISLIVFLIYNFEFIEIDISIVYLIINTCLVLGIFYLSFNGIKQYSIADFYHRQNVRESQRIDVTNPKNKKVFGPIEKYKSSSLSPEDAKKLHSTLLVLFEKEQIFLEPQLQIQEVANQLKTTTHLLSQTINTLEKKPFYDFVNSYRLEHFKRLLKDPTKNNYTILALGFDSGFNSKASLNRIFKQATGMSPREYQKSHLTG